MTREEYYAAVRALGLSSTKVATVFSDADGIMYNVPIPDDLPAEVRGGIIRRLRAALGVEEKSQDRPAR